MTRGRYLIVTKEILMKSLRILIASMHEHPNGQSAGSWKWLLALKT